jgi:hypothetical protein
MFKARAAGVNVSHMLREHTIDHTLTSKQKRENEKGNETHLILEWKGVEIMHQANLAEDGKKSRRRGDVRDPNHLSLRLTITWSALLRRVAVRQS